MRTVPLARLAFALSLALGATAATACPGYCKNSQGKCRATCPARGQGWTGYAFLPPFDAKDRPAAIKELAAYKASNEAGHKAGKITDSQYRQNMQLYGAALAKLNVRTNATPMTHQ